MAGAGGHVGRVSRRRLRRQLPGGDLDDHAPRPRELKAAALAGLSDAQRAVLAALADGHTRSGSIVERTGLAAATVSRALAALAERDLATRQAHGEWAATDAAGAA